MPNWVNEARKKHANNFAPDKFDRENWKYLQINNFNGDFQEQAKPITASKLATLKQQELSKNKQHLLTFVDGQFCPELSLLANLPKEIICNSIKNILITQNNLLQEHFNQEIPNYLQPFASLNFATFTDGYYLSVPAKLTIVEPLHILFLTTNDLQQKSCCLHNYIKVAENSQITLIEEYRSLGDFNYCNNIFTTMHAANNSILTHFKVQQESSAATHLHNCLITQQQNSQVQTKYAGSGSLISRNTTLIKLNELMANYEARGIYLLKNTQTSDYHTKIEHLAPDTSSNVLFKGILNDNATGIFKGRVFVDKNTQKTETHLTNKNLSLAPSATMYTSPELEIYAEDVICTHGATVGQLDPEAIYYLQTRGIAEPAAKKLLIQGFIQDILNDFPEQLKLNDYER